MVLAQAFVFFAQGPRPRGSGPLIRGTVSELERISNDRLEPFATMAVRESMTGPAFINCVVCLAMIKNLVLLSLASAAWTTMPKPVRRPVGSLVGAPTR
jgi:hypothetical protein